MKAKDAPSTFLFPVPFGRSEAVMTGDNKTADGKAQNRRVEFVKI